MIFEEKKIKKFEILPRFFIIDCKPGLEKKPKKPGFFGLNQVFFLSHICAFMNENSHFLEQLITNINYYLI